MRAVPKRERGGGTATSARKQRSPAAKAVETRARDLPAALSALFLATALAATALVFDSGAESSFDAPKRLLSLLAIAGGTLAAFGLSRWENPLARPALRAWWDGRAAAALAGIALLLAFASAAASPHRDIAFDSMRALLVMGCLLPLGASRVLIRHRGALLAAFLATAAINAAVSILEARRIYQPFPLVTQGDREATGAFVGNVGYLALALALAAVAALGVALAARRPAERIAAGALALLFAAALLANRNLTSLSALGAGTAVLLFGLAGRRALLPLGAAVLAAALGIAVYAPMRGRAVQAARSLRAGDWDQLLSYRTAPWAAALWMIRDRPLLGFGPGTFGAEFVPHRLQAEIDLRRRLTSPLASSTYGEAHCDYIQPFAEAGVPAGVAVLGAAALLLGSLARFARSATGSAKREAVLLLALLAAGAMAAVTWFPLQRPITALPLLLAAGRAWRISRGGAEGASTDGGRAA